MKNTHFAAVAALSAFALVACDNTQFNPEGEWLFNQSGYEGNSTYLNAAHDVSAEYTLEELLGGVMPIPMPVNFAYDRATSLLTIGGSDYQVVNRIATLDDMQTAMMAPGFNCEVTEYETRKLHFEDAAGSEARVRYARGFKLRDTAATNNCSDALEITKMLVLSGTTPPDLELPMALGLLKPIVLDQLRSFEVAQIMTGEKTSASASVDGDATEGYVVVENLETSAMVSRVLTALLGL